MRDRRRLAIVRDDSDAGADGWPVFVDPGDYRVALEGVSTSKTWGAPKKWEIEWRVVEDGPAFGVLLPMYATRLNKDDRLHPARKIVELFAIGTDLRPPSDLWRIRPERFLAECVFVGRIETVNKNNKRIERPDVLHYSVVSTLVRRESGSPPLIQERNR